MSNKKHVCPLFMHTRVPTQTHSITHAHMHKYTQVHTCSHAQAHKPIHAHTHKTQAHQHQHSLRCLLEVGGLCNRHTYAQTHIHTYTHACTDTPAQPSLPAGGAQPVWGPPPPPHHLAALKVQLHQSILTNRSTHNNRALLLKSLLDDAHKR